MDFFLRDASVESVGEDGDAEPGPGAGPHLDELPPALEVLAEHEGRRLADHRVADAKKEAVAGEREWKIWWQM